ncbi:MULTISPECIES: TolC family protein [unclassified Sphingobacterium]|uniref:TolC family protein n=1 Tax=unclassified Sphingobacterium TaxID=2609468 RepID=UPI0016176F7F|nr:MULTISPECIES: TolC family protein [unclassified Sphingobacterium]MBB2952703.1 outer membrane protein [Sphingobacterium sp. JUb56]QQD14472.1 TolC family protein [Sphingobacterium sp. UDSM-2020]
MKRIFIYGLCFLYSLTFVRAQVQQRSLNECIQLAIKANPALMQNELDVRRADINLKQAKANRLPDVNAGLNHGFSTGRILDKAVNQYTTTNNSSGGASLGVNVPVFNGFRILHDVRMKADAKTASKLEFDSRINTLKLDVIESFIQILTAQDVLKQSELQTEVTREQVRRAEVLHKEGAIAPGDYFDLKGQLANDINAIENNKQILYVNRLRLSTLLNVDETSLGELKAIEFKQDAEIKTAAQLFDAASENLPIIPALDWRIKAAERNIKVVKSNYWPSLSFSAGLSTNYSNGADFGYFKQFNNNLGKSIGLNLNIPIFNHLAVYNQVKLAKLDLESAKFQKDVSLNELRTETAKAVFNLKNVSNNIVQLQEQQQSYSESFRIAQVHFEAGNSNSVLFLTAKNKLDSSQIQLLVKQYEWLLQKYINDYYAGSLNL